jgi:hypothetical protein
MIPAFFSSARMILLECHESPAFWGHRLKIRYVKIRKEAKITLLSNMGPQNMTVGCLEFSPNLSLLEHPTAMFQGPEKTRSVRCVM